MSEAERVEGAIRAAFAGVDRAGGLCWAETLLTDRWVGDPMLHHKAREESRDRDWMEVAEQADWDLSVGFSFLDPIGFRYYLAAAMVRVLRAGFPYESMQDNFMSLGFALALSETNDEYRLDQWSALDGAQRWAVAEFVRLMREEEAKDEDEEGADWAGAWGLTDYAKAWESYWREVYEAGPVAPAPPKLKGKKAAKRAVRRRIR